MAARDERVAANDVAFRVRVHEPDGLAAGTTLVLLHYFAGSADAWDPVAGALAAGGVRSVAVDLRGHGASDGPPGGYAVADGASDVTAVVAALGVGDYALVGHSMGGKLALALAARRPPGLRGLALLAPSPPTPEPMDEGDRARALASHGDRGAAEATADRITARPLSAAWRERVVADTLRTAPAAWHAWLAHGSREDVSADAGRVAVPVLAVAGGADRVIPEAVVRREAVARVPGARGAVVAGSGHLLPLEAPAETAALLRAFARDHAGAP